MHRLPFFPPSNSKTLYAYTAKTYDTNKIYSVSY